MWASLVPQVKAEEVRTWQGTIEIPMYVLGEENPSPPFPLVPHALDNSDVQLRRAYPYAMQDDVTNHRELKTYKVIFLENEFLKATILPEHAGRVLSLYDKTSHREVFYRNHVIKPSVWGVRGAWVSGGLEYNFPDAHTAVAVSPVSSTIRRNSDGSATVSLGDLDWVSEMAWEVDLTLRPGVARLEMNVTLLNSTPLTNLYWYWDIAAIYGTPDMQLIYPMREAYTDHRGEVYSFPVNDGVDWSYFKNAPEAMSLFARQIRRTFFGAYYHDSDYGVVHTSNYRDLPGKKMWTWGRGEDGKVWGELGLTDDDGPYDEIQAGRYETQLNYEFIPSRRVEAFTEYWYPIRGLGDGFVEANQDLALNVRFLPDSGAEKQRVEIAIYPTVAMRGAKIQVGIGSHPVHEFSPITFRPSALQKFDVPVTDLEAARTNLVVDIRSAKDQKLLHWSAADPIDGNPDFVPIAGTAEPAPKSSNLMTVEEIYQYGVKKEKESGVEEAKAGEEEEIANIYRRALEKDAGYTPALLKLAWRRYRAGDFRGAVGLLDCAPDRFDPEVNYAYGVIYRATRELDKAANSFWASSHYGGSLAPAFTQLGETLIAQKKYDDAIEWLRRSLDHNPGDALALTDLAVALRLAGKTANASQVLNQALEKMHLLPYAQAERQRLAGSGTGSGAQPRASKLLTAPYEFDYVQVAAWYRSLGDMESSDFVLQAALKDFPSREISPLPYYYLASNARLEGKNQDAERFAVKAAGMPYERVFPSRVMDALVLEDVIEHNPEDTHAKYFLGNLYFARGRYEDAAKLWKEAQSEGFEYSTLQRNLAIYTWLVKKDLEGAKRFLERAIQLAPSDYRLYASLDDFCIALGDATRQREMFEGAPATVLSHDPVRVRQSRWLALQKKYDLALRLLMNPPFTPGPGGEMNRTVYVWTNIQKGMTELRAGDSKKAEETFRQATEYPLSLGVGKNYKPNDAEAFFWLGEALKVEGNNEGARAAWQTATRQGQDAQGMPSYYPKGVPRFFSILALRELGRTGEADRALDELLEAVKKDQTTAADFYVAGLVERFRKHEEQAKNAFRHALELDPLLWEAHAAMD
jgi:tetratricopeptide (TPR) repeat protein